MRLPAFKLSLTLLLSSAAGAQVATGVRVTFPVITAAGVTPSAGVAINRSATPITAPTGVTYQQADYPLFYTAQAFVSGSPAVCAYHLWGTTKFRSDNPVFPTDYEDVSGPLDCTQSQQQMVHVAWKPLAMVLFQVTSLSAGGSVVFQLISVGGGN